MTLKRTMCALLAASMLTTGVVAVQSSASAATVEEEPSAASYGLASEIKNGNILHALNWKLSDIKAELPNIAAAGFTAVQTSPIQAHDGSGHWYWLYQPINFWPGNELGSEEELKSLCAEADKYGVKIVVDVVANHFAGNHSNIPDDLKADQYYHNTGIGTTVPPQRYPDWSNRWEVTRCDIGMPDLNSENSLVQTYVKNYVQRLKADGVDGIRWDAAKHIGLPSEDCNFWPAVLDSSMYNYGEILDSPGGDGASVMKEYTKYMSVTDNKYSNETRGAFQGNYPKDGYGNWTAQGVPASGIVYWAESHDTFFNGMESQEANTYIINKAYAAIACRNGSQALYMSRPTGAWHHDQAGYGEKGDTKAAFSKEVAAVNHFRNAMGTKEDYYTTSNNCAVITRKDGGAVIVKGSGDGYVEVTNGGGYAKTGTFKDEISGNTFEVTASTIKGQVGDTGIAVIYDASDSPIISTDTSTDKGTDTSTVVTPVKGVNIYFDNSAYNWSSVYAYVYDDSGSTTREKSAWPGVQLTQKNSEGYFVLNVDDYANGKVIFAESASSANRYPADMQPGLEIGGKSHLLKAGNQWVEYTEKVSTDTSTDKGTDKGTDTSTVVTGTNIYFDNAAYNWSSVYAYVYDDSASTVRQNSAWPGVKMTEKNSEGYFVLNVDDYANGKVIFTESESSANRYPADMQPGLEIGGKSHLLKAGNQWVEYTEKVSTDTSTDTSKDTSTDTNKDTNTDTSTDTKISVLCGDANQDGAVSLRDASLILKATVGKATFKGNGKTAADVDGDGKITTSDSLAVQRYDIGIASNSIGSKVSKAKVA